MSSLKIRIRPFIRWFHPQLPKNGLFNDNKSIDETIKRINKSSLTNKERKKDFSKDEYKELPEWKKQNIALKEKFKGEKWNPTKKLSRVEIDNVRLLKSNFPKMTATELGRQFKVSPETIRRILKSKWKPNEDELVKLDQRWKRRGERINSLYEDNLKTGTGVRPNLVAPNKIVIGYSRDSSAYTVKNSYKTNSNNSYENRKNQDKKFGKKNKLFLLNNPKDL